MKKKALTPAEKREAVDFLVTDQQCSVSKACKIVQLPRSSYQYKLKVRDDSMIQDALTVMVSKHLTISFWQSYSA